MTHKNKVLAIVGPTGSGKTALAVKIAKRYDGIIISADSRQIYRGLDVGTNKEGVSGQWRNHPARIIDDIPQLLVDAANPGERFTLSDWLERARLLLDEIWINQKLPIVVGGTGLYVTALFEGYVLGQGRFAKQKKAVDFTALTLQQNVAREKLYALSDERFPKIFDQLVDEVRQLLSQGVSPTWLEVIGLDYRYAARFMTGKLDRAEAISQFQAASRQYIRRQLTWWRHHGTVEMVNGFDQACSLVEEFLNKGQKPVM